MEEVGTTQAFLIFNGGWGTNRWRVTAACKTSMSVLGIHANDLHAGHVHIDALLPGMVPTNAMMKQKAAAAAAAHHSDGTDSSTNNDDEPSEQDPSSYAAHAARNTATNGKAMRVIHTPLMNELLNISGTSVPGVEVALNVLDWTLATRAHVKAKQQQQLALSQRNMGATGSRRASNAAAAASQRGDPQHQNGSTNGHLLRSIPATAKLQEIAVKFIPGPVYVLRWRVTGAAVALGSSLRHDDGVTGIARGDDDASSINSGDSNRVQDSDSEADDTAAKRTAQPKTKPNTNDTKVSTSASNSKVNDDEEDDAAKPHFTASRPPAIITSLFTQPAKAAAAAAPGAGTGARSGGASTGIAAAANGTLSPVRSGSGEQDPAIASSRVEQSSSTPTVTPTPGSRPNNVVLGSDGLPIQSILFSELVDRTTTNGSTSESDQVRSQTRASRKKAGVSWNSSNATAIAPGDAPTPPQQMAPPLSPVEEGSRLDEHGSWVGSSIPTTADDGDEGKAGTKKKKTPARRRSSTVFQALKNTLTSRSSADSETRASALVPVKPQPAPPADDKQQQPPHHQHAPTGHSHGRLQKNLSHGSHHSGHRHRHGNHGGDMSPFGGLDADGGLSPPSGVHKAAGSVGSGSSTGSSKVTDALRKGITLHSRRMEASLVNLRRALFFIFGFIASMNVVSLVIANVLYSDLQSQLEIVRMNGQRGILLQSVYSEIQRMRVIAAGMDFTTDNCTGVKTEITESLSELVSVHQTLYSRMDDTNAAEHALYSTPSITVYDLVPGSYIDRMNFTTVPRQLNLVNAGLEAIAKARQLIARPYTDIVINESTGTTFWMLSNAPQYLRNGFNDSMLIANAKTSGVADTIMLVNDIVLGLALGLLFLVSAAVMVPAIQAVLRQKASILQVFVDTPMAILRSLRSRTEAKIVALKRASEEADAGLDVGGQGEVAADDDIQLEDIDPDAAFAATTAVSAAAAAKKGKGGATGKKRKDHARHFKRGTSFGSTHITRFVVPMLIMGVYYCVTWWWRQNVAETTHYATSEVFYSNQVAFFIGQAEYNIRNTLTYCEPGFIKDQRDKFMKLRYMLEKETDALLYGSSELSVRPLLKVSAGHEYLFMTNGCVENNNRYYDVATCENTFYDGLVGKGLQGAYKQFLELVTTTVENRYNSRYEPNCQLLDVSSGVPKTLELLAQRYLAAGYINSADMVYDSAISDLDTFMSLNIGVTIASIAALLIFYWVIYTPVIRRMDAEIKNVRMLLLLFPDEVSRVVPAIIAAGRDLLRDGQTGGSGSSVGSGVSGHSHHTADRALSPTASASGARKS